MAITEFSAALNQVATERGISPEVVLETINLALVAAYRKDFPGVPAEELSAEVDPETGAAKVLRGEEDVTPSGFGRIASQTAKQVILQKIRESEKEAVMEDFRTKIGTILPGHIFRIERGVIIVDLGRAQGVMPPSEQIPNENYQINQRTRVLVKEVREGTRGPEIIVSRADPQLVTELFALEVPEIASGTVKVEAIAREAGQRTKVSVSSSEANVDPVGSCVGQKGVRVHSVIAEIGEEKIDIVPFSLDKGKFIASALSPAKVNDVRLNERKNEAVVIVDEDQLSLAIGKGGQNVRLAAKMTGWKIDIKGPSVKAAPAKDKKDQKKSGWADSGLSTRTANALTAAGVKNLDDLQTKTPQELGQIKGIGPKALQEIKSLNLPSESVEAAGVSEADDQAGGGQKTAAVD